MLLLTEPINSGFLAVRPSPKTLCKAVASMGSPTYTTDQQSVRVVGQISDLGSSAMCLDISSFFGIKTGSLID